jgi:phage tail protein X
MITTYTTRQGDMIDAIVHRYFGATAGIVEQVIEANRSLALADYGPVLPAGLMIELPGVERKQEEKKVTRLWE